MSDLTSLISSNLTSLLSDFLYYSIVFEQQWWWIIGIVGGCSFVFGWAVKRTVIGLLLQVVAFLSLLLQPVLFFVVPELVWYLWGEKYSIDTLHIYAYLIGFSLSAGCAFFLVRHLHGSLDGLKDMLIMRTGLERDQRSDIRSVASHLPKAMNSFNPTKYFKKSKKLFLGLNRRRSAQYIPQSFWRSAHIDIIGTTGSGKGVVAGVILAQAHLQGESIVIIDPKNDEWLPHVLGQMSLNQKKPFYYIDLSSEFGQWNPVAGKNSQEIEELLSAGFGLSERGTDADFYRLNDRKSARSFSNYYQEKGSSLPGAYAQFISAQSELLADSPKFSEDMEELISLKVTHADKGLDIARAIEQGAVIYVKGSIRNPRILKLQKMFVLSVMQFCEKRDRDSARHVCMFLDEFKYLISKPALEALGAIRDKRAHIILAHQSLGDLRDCPKDIDPESVVASVNENCAIKIAYKVRDPDTADWLARMSGKILVDDEQRTVKTTGALAEVKNPDRMIRQAERCLIDTNMLQSLPDRCAAIYGNGLADFIFTSPVVVKKQEQFVTSTVFESYELHNGSDAETLAEDLLNVD